MIEPREFLHLANRLSDNSQGSVFEEDIRTSISRAYYFILLSIRDELEVLGVRFQKSVESHKEVTEKLQLTNIPQATNVAQQLTNLRIKRNKADYDLNLSGYDDVQVARLAIAEAENIERLFDGIDRSELRIKFKI